MSSQVYFDEQHIQGMQLIMKAAGVREVRIRMEEMVDPTLPGGTLRCWTDVMKDELIITYTPASDVIDGEEVAVPARAISGGE